MALETLDDLFLHELKDIFDAERQILRALPKMAKAAESEELKAAFEEHKSVTEEQVERLETIFQSLGKAARGTHCTGIEGIIDKGEKLIKEEDKGPARDAALICGAQKVEHYEMAAYGCLTEYAKLLEMDEAVDLLHTTLEEEKETDEKLTQVASELNLVAQEQAAE